MHVGVPKEVKSQEFRVGVTPGAVREFARDGHLITVETGAGLGIGATDDDYRRSGAQVVA
jgi:alanine dehydrogenase